MSIRDQSRIRKNKLDVWRQYLELGKSAYELQQYGIGDKMFKAAAHESGSDEEMCCALAEILEGVSDWLAKRDAARSERLYKRAIALYDRIGNDWTNASACRILYKLAELSVGRNMHEVALRYFGKALIVSRRSAELSPQTHLDLLRSLGAAWSQKGRHQEALIVHKKTVRILKNQ
ncbi:MAG: hypothetical protein K2Y39_16555 [Candidatus Obscuribacterales bacterium]|nr:hypothetical protein [Candidatus Obscuribacterales bacterium]